MSGQALQDMCNYLGGNQAREWDYWLKAFLTTLQGMVIDWYTKILATQRTTWNNLKGAYEAEFRLLQEDNEIVDEIYNTHQGKNEITRAYQHRPKELIAKMENEPTDGLKKRWLIECLTPFIPKKMKLVPTSMYKEICDQEMDIKSENKTSRNNK